jgi:hypothetical protein
MIRLSPGLAVSVRKNNPLMKPGEDQQTPPATAKTIASALIIVATPCRQRSPYNHALHDGCTGAHDADLPKGDCSILEQLCCPEISGFRP